MEAQRAATGAFRETLIRTEGLILLQRTGGRHELTRLTCLQGIHTAKNKAMPSRSSGSVFSVLLLLAALGLLLLAGVQSWRSVRAATWPTTSGTVTRTWLEPSGGSGGRKRIWTPHVAYTYTVGGVPYSGERLTYGTPGNSDYGQQQRGLRRYPVGGAVRVHYAPGTPQESVLESGLRGIPWMTFVVGTIVLMISGWAHRSR